MTQQSPHVPLFCMKMKRSSRNSFLSGSPSSSYSCRPDPKRKHNETSHPTLGAIPSAYRYLSHMGVCGGRQPTAELLPSLAQDITDLGKISRDLSSPASISIVTPGQSTILKETNTALSGREWKVRPSFRETAQPSAYPLTRCPLETPSQDAPLPSETLQLCF